MLKTIKRRGLRTYDLELKCPECTFSWVVTDIRILVNIDEFNGISCRMCGKV